MSGSVSMDVPDGASTAMYDGNNNNKDNNDSVLLASSADVHCTAAGMLFAYPPNMHNTAADHHFLPARGKVESAHEPEAKRQRVANPGEHPTDVTEQSSHYYRQLTIFDSLRTPTAPSLPLFDSVHTPTFYDHQHHYHNSNLEHRLGCTNCDTTQATMTFMQSTDQNLQVSLAYNPSATNIVYIDYSDSKDGDGENRERINNHGGRFKKSEEDNFSDAEANDSQMDTELDEDDDDDGGGGDDSGDKETIDESSENARLINGGDIDIPEDTQQEIDELMASFPGLTDQYRLVGKIGEGTFSTVYKAVDLLHDKYENSAWSMIFQDNLLPRASWDGRDALCAAEDGVYSDQPSSSTLHDLNCHSRRYSSEMRIVAVKKIYVTSSPKRIANEIAILRDLGGSSKIVSLITAMRHQDQVVLVMPYFKHDDFRTFYQDSSIYEIRKYCQSLFQALEHTHAQGIMHRDVKPSNFLYNVRRRHGVLVDFGLAEREDDQEALRLSRTRPPLNLDLEGASRRFRSFDSKGRPGVLQRDPRPSLRANRAGTRGFRAPEVLLKLPRQSVAIDIWSAGVILLCFFTKRFPFFRSTDDTEALLEIAVLFGKFNMEKAAAEMGRTFFTNVPTVKEKDISFERLTKAYNPDRWSEIPQEGFDFLRRCLCLDPKKRITAEEALRHPFLTFSNGDNDIEVGEEEAEEGSGIPTNEIDPRRLYSQ